VYTGLVGWPGVGLWTWGEYTPVTLTLGVGYRLGPRKGPVCLFGPTKAALVWVARFSKNGGTLGELARLVHTVGPPLRHG